MLFNSTEFVLAFMPITLIVFFLCGKIGWRRAAIAWLVAASAFFYAWFSVRFLGLLAILILFNYALGIKFAQDFRKRTPNALYLAFGITVNLAVLAYFKYTNFLIDNANAVLGTHYVLQKIILPIGISFFTFQKIAYLVDAYRGDAEEYNFLEFSLFVMYFPQLIAGPIVHHKEIIPQFRHSEIRLSYVDLAAGLTLFAVGLFKKVMIADLVTAWSDPVFAAAKAGTPPDFFAAWGGALSFTFQIYFDFSGYTDMALGLALMMGIRLPLNFDSPYKSTNIIDFWRRWHMTLSRFLRDYVYIPLGGNRRGPARRYVNLLAAMLLGGLWHGAAWTFVVWGALHGLYLIINHGWHSVRGPLGLREKKCGRWRRISACLITFLAVVIAWVFFRAESFRAAKLMIKGMLGLHGVIIDGQYKFYLGPLASWLQERGAVFGPNNTGDLPGLLRPMTLLGLMVVVWTLPNSQELLARFRPALAAVEPAHLAKALRGGAARLGLAAPDGTFALTRATGAFVGAVLVGCLVYQAVRTTTLQPFIYFQF
jgi:D-alanyl-lipoteichoic acid acyltransferase DltB (MBOAT superfamily)